MLKLYIIAAIIVKTSTELRASNKMPLHSSGLFFARLRWPNQKSSLM